MQNKQLADTASNGQGNAASWLERYKYTSFDRRLVLCRGI